MEEVKFKRKLAPLWKTYFPDRNGIIPNMKEGRNFMEENLHYMSKPYIAKDIADRIEQSLQNSPYVVIEICAGIGGNTLEFLSRKNAVTVISYERDYYRSVMLRRNIMEYDLGYKSSVINEEATWTDDFNTDFKDAVYYFDPPWLPESLKDAGDTYHQEYIRKGMKVGGFTLEEWLANLTNSAYLVVFRVPPGYEMESVNGWTYVVDNLGKEGKEGKLYMCYPNRHIKGSDVEKFGGYVTNKASLLMNLKRPNPELAAKLEEAVKTCKSGRGKEIICQKFVKYSFVDPEPLESDSKSTLKGVKMENGFNVGEYVPLENQVHRFTDIPTPTIRDKMSPEWVAEFQNYLSVILMKIVENKEIVTNLLTGEQNMGIWIQTFTHESIEPDTSKNYESLEFIGDALLKGYFKVNMDRHFKGRITAGEGTSYANLYLSKDYQPFISKYLKLSDWMIVSSTFIDRHSAEDLTESFCAALFLTGNNYKNGVGGLLVDLYAKFIMKPLVFNNLDKYGVAKQVLTQNFSRVGQKDNIYAEEKQVDGLWSFTIKVRNDAIAYMKTIGVELPTNGILTTGSNKYKTAAEKIAWASANSIVISKGFTQELVDSIAAQKKWDVLEDLDPKLYSRVKYKLRSEGYSLELSVTQKGDVWVVQINGKNDKGRTAKLGYATDRDQTQAKLKAFRSYVDAI